MRSFAIIPAVALFALVQRSPAPILAVPALAGIFAGVDVGTVAGVVGAVSGVAGAVEGGIQASHSKRTEFRSRIKGRQDLSNLGLGTAPEDCHTQLGTSTLTFSAPAAGTVLVEGMPPACMTLATVLTGKFDEGDPVPMSSSSIQFSNLSDDDIQQIQDALNAKTGIQK